MSDDRMFLMEVIHQRGKTSAGGAKGAACMSESLACQQRMGSDAHVVTVHMWLWCR